MSTLSTRRTAVFEGIAGTGTTRPDNYLFRIRVHFERLGQSSQHPRPEMRDSVDKLCDLAVELVERSGFTEDVYLRPMVYLSGEVLGVRLHNVESDTLIFLTPFPAYLPETARCHTSTWRRVQDTGIPPRAKVTGIYVNSALAKTEANANGFDEAIMLNENGHVSEGSGENIFMVRQRPAHHPGPADNVLEGITQDVMEMAANDPASRSSSGRSTAQSSTSPMRSS